MHLNPNWNHLPIGQRMSVTEVAAALGVQTDSLRRNYLGSNPPRRLPDGVRVVTSAGIRYIIRCK